MAFPLVDVGPPTEGDLTIDYPKLASFRRPTLDLTPMSAKRKSETGDVALAFSCRGTRLFLFRQFAQHAERL